MSQWVTRLTLIAYLVGGWIIPSIHHHGSHAVTSSHTCTSADHSSADHSHGPAENLSSAQPARTAEICHRGCLHHAGAIDTALASTKTSTSKPSTCSAQFVATDDVSTSSCHGLCAVCIARTLASQRLSDERPLVAIEVVGSAEVPATLFHQLATLGIALSRGPPAGV